MGHKIILEKMTRDGTHRRPDADRGPHARLPGQSGSDDYKRFFRPSAQGDARQASSPNTTPPSTPRPKSSRSVRITSFKPPTTMSWKRVASKILRAIPRSRQPATDDPKRRKLELDKAGHLMYASHLSYTNDALLGADECDLLVDLARRAKAKAPTAQKSPAVAAVAPSPSSATSPPASMPPFRRS